MNPSKLRDKLNFQDRKGLMYGNSRSRLKEIYFRNVRVFCRSMRMGACTFLKSITVDSSKLKLNWTEKVIVVERNVVVCFVCV
jgi:hypothetical protein